MARLAEAHLTGRSVLLTAIVALGAGALSGLSPLLRIWRSDVARVLGEQASRASYGRRVHRVLGVLVVSQVALTVILLVGTGLMVKNLYLALGTDPGYRAENLLTLKIQLPGSRYRDEDQKGQFFTAALARFEKIPDVRGAGATSALEGDGPLPTSVRIVDGPRAPGAPDTARAGNEAVTPGYFRTLGVPLVEGRLFSERDIPGAPRVALVNETMAKRFWPGSDPLGQRVVFWDSFYGSSPPQSALSRWTVVGVVGDSRRFGYSSAPGPEMYIPFAQNVRRGMRLVLRTSKPPLELVDAVRSAIRELDPKLPIQDVRTMKEILGGPLSRSRLNLILATLFALGGVVLAGIGLYGVMAYSAARRRHEMGIRTALGAQRRDVARGVVNQAATLVAPGLVLGLAGGWAFGRVLRSQLPRVSAADPWIAAGACLLVALAAAPAVLFSTWRVLSTDPSAVLREE
jgi:putative ABC transport system permease protein